MERRHVHSGTQWEDMVGYARAIRVGPVVKVSGTTATGPDGRLVAEDDPYGQAVQALSNIERALVNAGARLSDVIRTRIYVVDIGSWRDVGRAHEEFFGAVRPATTMVEVSRLIEPGMLVEIEAEAYVAESSR